MSPWWHSVDPGSRVKVFLIQVDIAGHSAWLAKPSAANYLEPCRERERLANDLQIELGSRGYPLLFWAGDGGVFAGRTNRAGHPEQLCDAAAAVFSTFNKWKKKKGVEIRVTATTMELNIDPNPGNWCGPNFNEFLKYEREIGLSNSFVITQELRAALTNEAEKKRFQKERRVRLPNGELVTTYIDDQHPFLVTKLPQGFGAWLRNQIQSNKLPESALVERSLLRVGDSTILDTAHQASGYGEIVLEQQAPLGASYGIDAQDKEVWEISCQELETQKVSGTSLQVR